MPLSAGDKALALRVGVDADHFPVHALLDGFCDPPAAGDKVIGLVVGKNADGSPIIAFSDQTCEGTGSTFEVGKKYLAVVKGRNADGTLVLASACKPCGETPPPPDTACGCELPNTLYATWADSGIATECKLPDGVIELNRCTLADVMCGISYNTRDGDGILTDTDNTAGIACLESVWGSSGNYKRVQWYCWKSSELFYLNDCCDPGNFPVPGHCWGWVTVSGTLYYMVAEYQNSTATAPEDFDAHIVPEFTNCCWFLWLCSVVSPDDPFNDPYGGACALVLEGMHPVNYLNGRARRANTGAAAGTYSGCTATSQPCRVVSGGNTTQFEACLVAFDGFHICEHWSNHIAHAGFGGTGIASSPGPLNGTCDPFYQEWSWTAGAAGFVAITINE
jgi:hypothetical protein